MEAYYALYTEHLAFHLYKVSYVFKLNQLEGCLQMAANQKCRILRPLVRAQSRPPINTSPSLPPFFTAHLGRDDLAFALLACVVGGSLPFYPSSTFFSKFSYSSVDDAKDFRKWHEFRTQSSFRIRRIA